MQPVLDIALIGCGRWGANLLRVLTQMPRIRVRAVCDLDPLRLGHCGALPGLHDVRLTHDADAVTQIPGLRAVVVASPPESHVSLGLSALAAGLDVFVEKPIGPSSAEARVLVEDAERRGAVLMVGHILEYHPYLQALRRAARAGVLGPIERIESDRHGCIPDDAWWALAPHDIGLARTFFGSARSLTARALDDGVVSVAIRMQNGAAVIRVSKNSERRVRRIGIIGRDASAVFDDAERPSLTFHGVSLSTSTLCSVAGLDQSEADLTRCPEPLRVELDAFVDAVVSRRSPVTDGWYGLEVVELLEAADRSRIAGGIPIPCHPSANPGHSTRGAGRPAAAGSPTLITAPTEG